MTLWDKLPSDYGMPIQLRVNDRVRFLCDHSRSGVRGDVSVYAPPTGRFVCDCQRE